MSKINDGINEINRLNSQARDSIYTDIEALKKLRAALVNMTVLVSQTIGREIEEAEQIYKELTQ